MKSKPLQYLLPGLLIGALGGYFFAEIRHPASGTRGKETPRAAFLSNEDEAFDYEKLAHVCLSVAQRSVGSKVEIPPLNLSNRSVDTEKVQRSKEYLDRLMSKALEKGAWTRLISFRARQLTGELPLADAADFASLFSSALRQGDLKVAPGAWVPETVN